MTPENLFLLCSAVNLHFKTSQYDFHKYRGEISRKPGKNSGWSKCPIKFAYERLASKYNDSELLWYVVANNVHGASYVSNMREPIFRTWIAGMESLEYNFTNDLIRLFPSPEAFNEFFRCKPNEYPELIKQLHAKKISLDTFTLLCYTVGVFGEYNKRFSDDTLWTDLSLKAQKYFPFIVDYHASTPEEFVQKYRAILKGTLMP